jgi:hypothetical protein
MSVAIERSAAKCWATPTASSLIESQYEDATCVHEREFIQ